MNGRLKLLDLFSGIGGFSLGLRSCLKTIAYCEIDQDCQKVLLTQMSQNMLDKAPIWPDVRTLPIDTIQSLEPDVICAGSPCGDVSIANTSTPMGINGPRSGLIKDVIRIAGCLPSVSNIFFENSPMMKTRGMSEVFGLLRSAGFNKIRWCIFACSDLGGHHIRKRWYCLASRNCRRQYDCIRIYYQTKDITANQNMAKRASKTNRAKNFNLFQVVDKALANVRKFCCTGSNSLHLFISADRMQNW